MNTFTQETANEVVSKIEATSKLINRIALENGGRSGYILRAENAKAGAKYIRVARFSTFDGVEIPCSGSAWCFIDAQGNIWKPANYKAPTKNFTRGTIQDLESEEFVRKYRYGF